MTAEKCMTRARTRLLLDQPWFGSLAMRLQMIPDSTVPTVETDGTKLVYNPEFILSRTDADLLTIMAHELLHCALLHPYRRGARNADKWNKAADYAVNAELVAAGFVMPSDALVDMKYQGLSADVIYSQLGDEPDDQGNPSQEQGQGQGGPGQGQGKQPLSTGTVSDAPAPGAGNAQGQGQEQAGQGQPDSMTAEDWKVAAEQATSVSRACGNTPGGAARATKRARESAEDWRATLLEFVEHQIPSDFTWSNPNRRHIANGLYLPGILKENLGTLAVAVDTSGSISQSLLDCFAAELTAILHEARPEKVRVIYCDMAIQHEEEFTPDDPEIKLAAHGGGGTRFAPVFDLLNAADEAPTALLYFTDLENGREVIDEPNYPVLWCTGLNVTKSAPWGRTVRVDTFQP